MKRQLIPFVVLLLACGMAVAQEFDSRGLQFQNREQRWVDSVMHSLTLEQRIAQLMVVRVPLKMDDQQTAEFSARMNGYGVGGVCFFVGTAERQVPQTRRLQADAKLPLLVCLDAEWGLGMRLKDCFSFPKNAVYGRLPQAYDSIAYRTGREIGLQCREIGVHINFAPVVDINSNPRNPVIGTRSFGTDKERVAQLGIMYALGQQSTGVIATAKHFPGHGDTDADSHYELPVINHSRAYIDSVDTYPFRRLVDAGVQGVMTAHLQVNALDADRPSSLSPKVVNGLLREEMGFQGLVVTDGLDMKGVTNTYKNGQGELAALMAGNDILLLPPDVPAAIGCIKQAAQKDAAVRQAVDYHCQRVLTAKYRHVLPYIKEEIHTPSAEHEAACRQIVAELGFLTDTAIDHLAQRAIAAGATPGCQIVVMHRGEMVFDRCYGRYNYDGNAAAVDPETLYDLASLTKVTATTLAVMRLVDQGQVSVGDRLSQYLPYLKGTDKENITIAQALSHCAGLKPFDAYWQQTTNRDSLLALIAASPLKPNQGYLYSDLGFILLGDMVERVGGMPLDQYVSTYFYRPMGLSHTTFRPLDNGRFAQQDIAPTELDTLRGLICGTVHDPNAYALGGVSGHAGLFSTAREVAQLMQMLLDGGMYRGHRYLKESTVKEFTQRHFKDNRRGYGFDKPLIKGGDGGPCAAECTQSSFGHTGFTGTMAWVDPEHELVYVFLSNRVCPSSTPNRLAQMNIRTDIQASIYHILAAVAGGGTAQFGN